MRQVVIVLASLFVSGFFLWLALRDIPLAEVLQSMQQTRPIWLLVAVAMIGLGLALRAVRWRVLLGRRVPLREAFHIVNITFLLNQLPLRAGEVARSVLATRSGIPVLTAAASIVVERLLDTLLVVVLLAFSLASLPDVPENVTRAALFFGIAAIIGFGIFLVFARYPALPHHLLKWTERLIPLLKRLPLENMLDHLLEGLAPLADLRRFAHALLWTIISWSASILAFYALSQAFGIEGSNVWRFCAIAMCLASLSIAIPVSVMALGPFEAAVLVAGQLTGIDEITAFSLGLLGHVISVGTYAILGMIGFLVLGISISEVMQSRNKEKEIPQAS